MATITSARIAPPSDRFPPGTLVGAYRGNAWSGADKTVAPTGAADATATVAADGSLTFSGLTDGTSYHAYAAASGAPVRFTTRHDRADDIASALVGGAAGKPRYGMRMSIIADSILGATVANGLAQRGGDIASYASAVSGGRLVVMTTAGVSGETSAQLLARINTDIIGPGITDTLGIICGTNDASTGVPVATFLANMTAMVDAAEAAGIAVFLCTPPPNPSGAQRLLSAKYVQAIRYLASRRDLPVVPLREVWIDPTTGGYLASYDNGDGIHPNSVGRLAAGQAVYNTLAPLLPLGSVNTALFATADSPNMLPNGLFLVDTNADGVPDSYTKTGASITVSLVDATPDGVRGKWLRIQDVTNTFGQVNPADITTGFAAGDKLALSCRFKSAITSGSALFGIQFIGAAGNPTVRPALGGVPVVPGVAYGYMETVVPAGTTAIRPQYSGQGTGMDFSLGEPQLINLTALGIA